MDAEGEQHSDNKKKAIKFFSSSNVPKFSGQKDDFSRWKTQITWALQAIDGLDEHLGTDAKYLPETQVEDQVGAQTLLGKYRNRREISNILCNGISSLVSDF